MLAVEGVVHGETMECPKCKRHVPDGFTACRVCDWKLQRDKSKEAHGHKMRLRLGPI